MERQLLFPVLALVCCRQMGSLKRNILFLLLQEPLAEFHAFDLIATTLYEAFNVVLVGLRKWIDFSAELVSCSELGERYSS